MRPAIAKRLNTPDRILCLFSARGFFLFFGDLGILYSHPHPDSISFFKFFLSLASLHNNFCDIRGHHGKELLWIHLEKTCIVSTASTVMEKSLHMKRRGHVLRCHFSSNRRSLKIRQ